MVGERCLRLLRRKKHRVEARSKGRVERRQVSMPVLVTIKRVRNPFAESPRFPGPGSSSQGKSEPKARPKGVVDGQQVNIPAPC